MFMTPLNRARWKTCRMKMGFTLPEMKTLAIFRLHSRINDMAKIQIHKISEFQLSDIIRC